MSRSIGGQSRVYQPVAGGVPGGRRANVLNPTQCTFTESFNKADGTLGPDLEWNVDASIDWGDNDATVKNSQFACDLAGGNAVDDGVVQYRAWALTTNELCSNNVYAKATISTWALDGDPYDMGLFGLEGPYGVAGLLLRSGESLNTEAASYARFIVGYFVNNVYDPAAYFVSSIVVLADGVQEVAVVSGPVTQTITAGDTIRFEAHGTTYRGYLNGELIVSLTETGSVQPRGRHAGIYVEHAWDTTGLDDVRVDAFEMGSL